MGNKNTHQKKAEPKTSSLTSLKRMSGTKHVILSQSENSEFILDTKTKKKSKDWKLKYEMPASWEIEDLAEYQHRLWQYSWQSNFSAPIKQQLKTGITVLELGCGKGNWTKDMAAEYPKSKFTGAGRSKLIPKDFNLPNCKFVEGHKLRKLPFGDEFFDYIFMRNSGFSFTEEKARSLLMNNAVKHLKIGGYIEFMEDTNHPVNLSPKVGALHAAYIKAMSARGIWTSYATNMEQLMSEHPKITIIAFERREHPYGAWGDEFGMANANLYLGLANKYPSVTSFMETPLDVPIETYLAECEKEFLDPKYKGFGISIRVIGQKV